MLFTDADAADKHEYRKKKIKKKFTAYYRLLALSSAKLQHRSHRSIIEKNSKILRYFTLHNSNFKFKLFSKKWPIAPAV